MFITEPTHLTFSKVCFGWIVCMHISG